MSRQVIGHKDGKPIYRDEGPNVGLSTTQDPHFISPVMVVRRTSLKLGLPDAPGEIRWKNRER